MFIKLIIYIGNLLEVHGGLVVSKLASDHRLSSLHVFDSHKWHDMGLSQYDTDFWTGCKIPTLVIYYVTVAVFSGGTE